MYNFVWQWPGDRPVCVHTNLETLFPGKDPWLPFLLREKITLCVWTRVCVCIHTHTHRVLLKVNSSKTAEEEENETEDLQTGSGGQLILLASLSSRRRGGKSFPASVILSLIFFLWRCLHLAVSKLHNSYLSNKISPVIWSVNCQSLDCRVLIQGFKIQYFFICWFNI